MPDIYLVITGIRLLMPDIIFVMPNIRSVIAKIALVIEENSKFDNKGSYSGG